MPRRDVVLTGLIAFAAGCAVGANWPKIRKQMGPMIGKAGFKISELGEFLSESFPESESFFNAAAGGRAAAPAGEYGTNGNHVNGVHRNGSSRMNSKSTKSTASASKSPRKKAVVRRKKVVTVS